MLGGFAEDVLCSRVRAQLAAVPALPEWQARPANDLPLPAFTPYPLQYVTSAGENLMMLPQLLESALAADEGAGDEGGQLAAGWIDRAAAAAAAAYQQQLAQVGALSVQGAAQLAADLEYFTNVLGTLGVEVPAGLAAWQAAAAGPDAEALRVLAAAAAEGGDGGEAAGVVSLVARLRGFTLATPLPRG
jgi:hypothetical protein